MVLGYFLQENGEAAYALAFAGKAVNNEFGRFGFCVRSVYWSPCSGCCLPLIQAGTVSEKSVNKLRCEDDF